MLIIDPAGREYAKWNYTAEHDPTGDTITISIDGVDHAPTAVTVELNACPPVTGWSGVISLLVAGPDAVGNPVGTVVLSVGVHPVTITFPDGAGTLLLPAGDIEVVPAGIGASSGPCRPWDPDACVVFPDCTQMVSGYALDAATEVLWARTGRRYGTCVVPLRPCVAGCGGAGWWTGMNYATGSYGYPMPALIGGRWYNLACGTCGDDCSCTTLHQVTLPSPVAAILEVKVDGAVLPSSAYRVDDWNTLVRLDGGDFPRCNDLSLADTEPGTWSVTAAYGEAVPALGRLAVGALALSFATGMCGSTGCRVHAGTVKEITRQGVRKTFIAGDSLTGATGVHLADLFVATFNPTRSSPASIYPMDGPRHRRVGTS